MTTYKDWIWHKENKKDDQEITVHSLVAGNVLCRYWSDVEKSKEAKLIEKAHALYETLKELRKWSKEEYQNNPEIDKRVDDLLKSIEE
jgi:hypothetical protein